MWQSRVPTRGKSPSIFPRRLGLASQGRTRELQKAHGVAPTQVPPAPGLESRRHEHNAAESPKTEYFACRRGAEALSSSETGSAQHGLLGLAWIK